MAYLSREERRDQIMNAVVALVSRESLAAATVRRIAQETGCSLGQIHHHFASADALRAEAVRQVWNRLEPGLEQALRPLAPRERLLTVLSGFTRRLSCEDGPLLEIAERLWKEAWGSCRDPFVREAICYGFGKMRQELLTTLEEGIRLGNFPPGMNIPEVASRLMAASQGYDLLTETGVEGLNPDKQAFIDAMLRQEGI